MVDILKTSILMVMYCLFIGTEYATAVRIRRTRRITKPKPGRTKIPTTKVKVRNYYGQRYKSSYWKTGMAVGLVYGIASYKTRRRYLRYPDREPRICFNEEDLRNGTYGYFICPEWNQPDDYDYCCGEDGRQRCCTCFGGSRGGGDDGVAGRVAGIIAAVIFVCAMIGIAVYCMNARRRRKTQGQVIVTSNLPGQPATQDQTIPLNKPTETIQYPTGGMQVPPQYGGYANAGDTQGPPPPQYGGYGTGMNDPGGFYSSNAGPPYHPGPQMQPGTAQPPYPIT